MDDLRRALAGVPDPEVPVSATIARAIDESIAYLESDDALASIEADTYWPKWDSPWWHMLLLHEIGESGRIPARVVTKMIEGMNALPIHIFPIHPEDTPPGADPHRHASCHCALGCLYAILTACGVDVDRALPWVKPWFLRYQMADGGLNCDAEAYLQADECPSSMVGTIAPFEAMLLGDPAAWTGEQRAFLDRAAGFLVERRLMLGSSTRHNAEERTSQQAWLRPCFPRFYLYDVIRGASALVRWADASGRTIPRDAVSSVVAHLVATFPDGVVRNQRRCIEGIATRRRSSSGEWTRQPAGTFALLEATSALGEPCAYTTRQWSEARRGLLRLLDEDRVV